MESVDYEKGALLLINKPYQWTSFDVVNYVRKILKVKIGHAGTLDPLATGLLILCTGKMTKSIDSFMDLEKEYTGTFVIGASTPSYDLETEIDAECSVKDISREQIETAAQSLLGKTLQNAPLYSAKKIDGERAYYKARRGEKAEIKAREINISCFDITSVINKGTTIEAGFKIICSKGTYIRAIARDLALALNNVGHLNLLTRTRIGDFMLENAQSMEDLRKQFPLKEAIK